MKKGIVFLFMLVVFLVPTVGFCSVEAEIPMITEQPQGTNMELSTASFFLSIRAMTKDDGTLTYQWYSTDKDDISSIMAIYDENDGTYGAMSTFTPKQEEGTKYYCCMVTNSVSRNGITDTAYIYSNLVPVTFTKRWVNKFDIKIDSPKTGEAPDTTPVRISGDTLNEFYGYTITGTHWSPNDKVFKANMAYTVSFDVKIDKNANLRSDYFAVVNGKEAKMPIDFSEKNFISYTFPKTDIEVKAEDTVKSEVDENMSPETEIEAVKAVSAEVVTEAENNKEDNNVIMIVLIIAVVVASSVVGFFIGRRK